MVKLKELRPRQPDSDENQEATEPGACAECTSLCHLLHWDKTDLYPSVLRFFKIMLGEDWNKVMILPPIVTATVTGLVGKETELEDTHGVRSTVTLSSSSRGLAFQRGWESFVSEHNISVRDFLVFNYIKGSHFVVHIFGGSGREKLSFKTNPFSKNVAALPKSCETNNMNATKRFHMSSPMASGSKFQPSLINKDLGSEGVNTAYNYQPSATRRTQDSRDANVKPSNQPSGDANMKPSNQPSTSYRTRNSVATNVKLSCSRKFHNFNRIEVHERNDQNAPQANEGTSQEFTDNNKKKVKTEPEELSDQVDGHVRRKRGSYPSQDRVSNQKKVKVIGEPSSCTLACLAVTDCGHYLELPEKLPDVLFRKSESSKPVVLKDRVGKLWPALYHEASDVNVLVSHWKKLNQEIGIQAGESYLFKAEDPSRSLYTIDVLRSS
ncbi:OLC1v1013520C2 [Oldenlandia corymbosa var. corymbosa]|uniref:OLC1v1013520C2 n=1 Tax=Oldenlandia corymbosa var. corymbosa TaxID=529605 RepID=A0AAV1DYF6_OLDCO|nr:OLC1v1013520C2 [Oldenlandia corymbosa var. corymbosa]